MLLLRFRVLLAVARLSSGLALFNTTNSTTHNNSSSNVLSNATSTVLDGVACNAEYISYSLASKAYSSTAVDVTKTITNTYNYNKTVFASTTFDCATKCDTICYATNVSSTISLSSVSSENVITYSARATYTAPTPSCSIGFRDCLSLLTSYSVASTSSYSAKRSGITLDSVIRPSCSACVATGCTFQHAAMSLYYWPVTTSYSKDMCAWDPVAGQASTYVPDMNRTYIPTTTGPYAVVEGRTLYQGNVYLSIMDPYVYDNCGNSISRQNTAGDNMITIASTDLMSVRKYPHNLIPWSVNYADFIEPVPWSAYYGGRYCANNRPLCSVVMPGQYQPDMVMPPQMRNLDPAWESCAFDQYGLFDPPVALTTVPMFLGTTTTEGRQKTTDGPAPGSFPPVALPSATAMPSNDEPGTKEPGTNPEPGNDSPSPSPGATQTKTEPVGTGTPVKPPVITVGPSIVTVDPTGGVVIAPGTTLSSGGPSVVVSSTTLSIGSSGLVIVTPATSTNFAIGPVPTTINLLGLTDPIVLTPDGTVVIAPGTTISVGGPGAVISSTTFSIGASGLVVIAPASRTQISLGGTGVPITLPGFQQVVMYMDSKGRLVLEGGKTLHAGDPAVTVDGTTIGVDGSKVVIVHGKTTETYDISVTSTQASGVIIQAASAIEDVDGEQSVTRTISASAGGTGAVTAGENREKGAAETLMAAGWEHNALLLIIATCISLLALL